ncbi:hypothetical protein PF005_g30278 [Phytophthora fragariae]|uniref:Secreted protein n=1 Tax=Phytophthora fragariae TaxID=53985 RepID=A0A6A3EQ22_9STRA|nr:hypothetical protein PF003_g27613 [Phytophthora fragariae]KAE8934001.1 hypothetical protein PF009_g16011 [Phytophthora fragariae]KAE9147548.1 hypothetical protein PF006_g7780 [Phytophthora fragariae]KAE9163835.1 hypothetical protein PF005_g30278 [Phytophthora fragariae]KAE9214152.1 hypothetical protein PF002_g17747 [Phytophthora fragariae]
MSWRKQLRSWFFLQLRQTLRLLRSTYLAVGWLQTPHFGLQSQRHESQDAVQRQTRSAVWSKGGEPRSSFRCCDVECVSILQCIRSRGPRTKGWRA